MRARVRLEEIREAAAIIPGIALSFQRFCVALCIRSHGVLERRFGSDGWVHDNMYVHGGYTVIMQVSIIGFFIFIFAD